MNLTDKNAQETIFAKFLYYHLGEARNEIKKKLNSLFAIRFDYQNGKRDREEKKNVIIEIVIVYIFPNAK